jgi:hypothetical protein
MKTHYTMALAMLAGFGLGAIGVQGLHAQTKPPIYYVAEVDVTDLDGYMKEYAPKAAASSKAFGGPCCGAGGHSDRRRATETTRCHRVVG